MTELEKESADQKVVEESTKLLKQLVSIPEYKPAIAAKTKQLAEQLFQWCEHVKTLNNLTDILVVSCSDQETTQVVVANGGQEQLVNALCFLIESEDTGRS